MPSQRRACHPQPVPVATAAPTCPRSSVWAPNRADRGRLVSVGGACLSTPTQSRILPSCSSFLRGSTFPHAWSLRPSGCHLIPPVELFPPGSLASVVQRQEPSVRRSPPPPPPPSVPRGHAVRHRCFLSTSVRPLQTQETRPERQRDASAMQILASILASIHDFCLAARPGRGRSLALTLGGGLRVPGRAPSSCSVAMLP